VFSLESWILSVRRKGKGSETFDFADFYISFTVTASCRHVIILSQRLAIWDQRI
jgi:hypothetical protein